MAKGKLEEHLSHLKEHNQTDYLREVVSFIHKLHRSNLSCPSTKARNISDSKNGELTNWPIQLHLISPFSEFYKNADVVLSADCVAFSCGIPHT